MVQGTSRCPHDAENKTRDLCYNSRSKLDENQGQRLTASEGRYTPSALGHSRLRMRPPKMFFTRADISPYETLSLVTRVGSDCP
jgi:hypothetical protein